MSESLLVTYCAPTLAGLKTGNLFNCTCTGRRQAEETVRQWNRTLNSKGVYAVIMRYREGRVLIYVYRRAKLLHDFTGTEVRRFLKKFGYERKICRKCWSSFATFVAQATHSLTRSDSFWDTRSKTSRISSKTKGRTASWPGPGKYTMTSRMPGRHFANSKNVPTFTARCLGRVPLCAD